MNKPVSDNIDEGMDADLGEMDKGKESSNLPLPERTFFFDEEVAKIHPGMGILLQENDVDYAEVSDDEVEAMEQLMNWVENNSDEDELDNRGEVEDIEPYVR